MMLLFKIVAAIVCSIFLIDFALILAIFIVKIVGYFVGENWAEIGQEEAWLDDKTDF